MMQWGLFGASEGVDGQLGYQRIYKLIARRLLRYQRVLI